MMGFTRETICVAVVFIIVEVLTCEAQETCQNLSFRCNFPVCKTVDLAPVETFEGCRDKLNSRYGNLTTGSGESNFEVTPELFNLVWEDVNMTGLNISIKNVTPGMKAVLLWFNIPNKEEKLCKAVLIDDAIPRRQPLKIWSCTYFRSNEEGENFTLKLLTYPQLSEWMVVSEVRNLRDFEPESVVNWKAAIFLITPNAKDCLKACFQQIPEHLGLFNYSLKLISDTGTWSKELILVGSTNGVLCKQFCNLYAAKYMAQVELNHSFCLSSGNKCEVSRTPPITIILPPSGYISTWYFSFIPVIGGIFLFIFIYIRFSSTQPTTPVKAVILYSYDNEIHDKTVVVFCELLRACNVEVIIDKSSALDNPSKWLQEVIWQKDVIIIMVMSAGAIYRAQRNESVLFEGEPGHLTGHLFHVAVNEVFRRLAKHFYNQTIFISIVWDNKKKRDSKVIIPQFEHYCLPTEWNKFLAHVHGVRTYQQLWCLRLQSWFNCSQSQSLGNSDVGRQFLEQCKHMKQGGGYFKLSATLNATERPVEGSNEQERNHNDEQVAPADSGYYSVPNQREILLEVDSQLVNDEALEEDEVPIYDEERGKCLRTLLELDK